MLDRGAGYSALGLGGNKRAKNSEHDEPWNCQIEPAAESPPTAVASVQDAPAEVSHESFADL
jgi:hypothetical protein